VEVATTRGEGYSSFIKTAADCCKLKTKKGKKIVLFNLKGVMISNQKSKPWTIGGYFAAMKCSASNLKIGIAYIDDDDGDGSEVKF